MENKKKEEENEKLVFINTIFFHQNAICGFWKRKKEIKESKVRVDNLKEKRKAKIKAEIEKLMKEDRWQKVVKLSRCMAEGKLHKATRILRDSNETPVVNKKGQEVHCSNGKNIYY